MESTTDTNKRIAKNTIILYLRMMIMMAIGFFTTRFTLSALGVENFGIYNVVGGLVSMFSLVSSSLSASISRFITFGLGLGNIDYLKKIFGVSMNIQIMLSIIVIVLLETIGFWFLEYKLVIPPERMFAAKVTFQLSTLSFGLSLLSMPYNAAIVAHEKMSAFAYMSLLEAVFKLLIPISLFYINADKLILFSALLVGKSIIIQMIYWIYCRIKFVECRFSIVKDRALYKEIFSFSGWNFIGSSAALISDQGVNILLNLFFGPIVNTARGIGLQVTGIMSQFSGNFMSALNPQITKNYASENINRVHSLIIKGSKLSVFLFLLISIPILLETRQVLEIWLGQVPDYTVGFVQLSILLNWSTILSNTLITAQLATGKLRNYQIFVGGMNLMNLPVSYIALRAGAPPVSVIVVAIVISQICLFLRLWFLRTMIGLSMRRFLRDAYNKAIIVIVTSVPIPLSLVLVMQPSIVRLIIVAIISIIITVCNVYFLGCDIPERNMIRNQMIKFKRKFTCA